MNAPSPVPAGTLALVGEAARRQREVERACLEHLDRAGYREVLLPVLEFAVDTGGEGYRFLDAEGRLLALRTDFTPLAARILAPCLTDVELPLAICYAGEVLRPRPPRLRQLAELYQLGFERYGEESGGAAALGLMLDLVSLAGVRLDGCHLSVSCAGLTEMMLTHLIGSPPSEELLELAAVRDVDRLTEVLDPTPARRQALEAALLAKPHEEWGVELGLDALVANLEPLLEVARGAGLQSAVDVAARLAGGYYTGAVFALWGSKTRGMIAGGGEYAVKVTEEEVPAVGACLALGMVLQEASW